MSKSFSIFLLFSLILSSPGTSASIFGEETAVLLEMVGNQLTELQRLTENVGIAKNQRDLLMQINDGIQQTTKKPIRPEPND